MTTMSSEERPGYLHVINPDGHNVATYHKELKLKDLQDAVGGYIEHVQVKFNNHICDAYVNEDGITKDLPPNRNATAMLSKRYALSGGGILGPMAIWVPEVTSKE